TTSTGRPANRPTRSRARSGSSEGSIMKSEVGSLKFKVGSARQFQTSYFRLPTSDFRSRRQRDDDQEEHQHFGVAEVVFEEPRDEQGHHRRQSARRQRPVLTCGKPFQQIPGQRDDEPQPDRERRQPALGGNLQEIV